MYQRTLSYIKLALLARYYGGINVNWVWFPGFSFSFPGCRLSDNLAALGGKDFSFKKTLIFLCFYDENTMWIIANVLLMSISAR